MLFVACETQTTHEDVNSQFLTKEQSMVVAMDYVYLLPDSTYELRITPEKAVTLGIAPKDYESMLSDVAQANVALEKMRAEGVNIDTPDPQSAPFKAKYSAVRPNVTKQGGGGGGSITVTTAGQGEGRGALFIKINAIPTLKVNCWATGLIQVFNVWINVGGNYSSNGGVGYFGAWDCTFSLVVTNAMCYVGFQTANTNGGYGVFAYDCKPENK